MPIHFTPDTGESVLGSPFYDIGTRRVSKVFKLKTSNLIKQIKEKFNSWLSWWGKGKNLTRLGFITSAIIGFLFARIQSDVIAVSYQNEDLTRSTILIIGALSFIALISIWIYSWVIYPFSKLRQYLNRVNLEEGIPHQFPDYGYFLPETKLFFKSLENLLGRVREDRDSSLKGLLREKRRADIISAAILDGIILLRGDELLYLNPIAAKILGLPSHQGFRGMRLRRNTGGLNSDALTAVKEAIGRAMPVEYTLTIDDRKSYYLIQTIPLTGDLIQSVEQTSDVVYDQVLDRFSADTLVLAHDVTLIREGQEAKGHFLATISHEIKTPVTSLTLATRLLKKSIDQFPNPGHRDLIETCVENVDRLRSLLDNLLTISRLETIAQKLEIQTIDFRKLVRHSVDSFAGEAKKKGIELSYEIRQKEKINIDIDASKLTWALSNLITNAFRHTPKGGKVTVEVETKQEFVLVRIR
ncbi:MAG: histidine kinase dimerization/phospho-acceptor domain-containing protein, partial [Bdellovibrionia bacterium]